MTNEEIVNLIQKNINIKENMALLYNQNKRFIYLIAKKYSKTDNIEDLMQEAYFGLYNATLKFDSSKGFKFLTYAEFHIKASIQQYVVNNERHIKIPLNMAQLITKYNKFVEAYKQKYNCKPSDDEIMKGLEITQEQFEILISCIYESSTISLQTQINDEDSVLENTISSEDDLENDICEKVINEQLKKELWNEVEKIGNVKTKKIIKLRYKDNKTLKKIAFDENISSERVRQIEYKGLQILRNKANLRKLAQEYYYNTSIGYKGNFTSFKNNLGSVVENLVIKKLEEEEKLIASIKCDEQERNRIMQGIKKIRTKKENLMKGL